MTETPPANRHLLVFGPGYSAWPFMEKALEAQWQVSATWRRAEAADQLKLQGINPVEFEDSALPENKQLKNVTHILVSIAPKGGADPVLQAFEPWIRSLRSLEWAGYLSSTNVYGDHGGNWVDETSETKPGLDRGKRRLLAEQAWTKLGNAEGFAVHIFRLAGIYGPGKNAIRSVLDGRARRVIKEGQVFGRIHREDIASALWLAANSNVGSNVFNISDDLPSPPQDVIAEAARLLEVAAPPEVPYEDADLSPMGRSFYEENKRVGNQKAKDVLGWTLLYPDYHQALPKLLKSECGG